MAFSAQSLQRCIALMAGRPKPWPIVCMGYPDILISTDMLSTWCGGAAIPLRADSQEVLAWHGIYADAAAGIAESTETLRMLGFEPSYIDIHSSRGGELIADMNEPLSHELHGKFAIVYDGGGLEHYFNVGQAVVNMLAIAAQDGFIYHANPHSVGNHGFFNFCPTFYADFYTQNGHEIVDNRAEILVNGGVAGLAPLVGRYRTTIEKETWIQVIVRKKNLLLPKWPMQSKYLASPDLKRKMN